jgi:competence protein ComGC
MLKNAKGFTLFEVALAIAIGAAIVLGAAPMVKKKAEDVVIFQTVARADMIHENALRFRIETGSWPANVGVLVSNNYITDNARETGFGDNFNISIVGADLELEIPTPNEGVANRIAGFLPTSEITGTTVNETITVTGNVLSFSPIQDLDGIRPWLGNYQAGGFNLDNLDNVSAVSLEVGQVRTQNLQMTSFNFLGAPCLTGQIGVSSTPQLLVCQSGAWAVGESPPVTPLRYIRTGSSINGMIRGQSAIVSVYGLTAARGTGTETLRAVRLTNCGSSTLASTRSLAMNWPDGSALHGSTFNIVVPASGCVRGFTDGGAALNMSAIAFPN